MRAQLKLGLLALVLPSYFPYNISVKVDLRVCLTVFLSVLVVLASSDVAFAQKNTRKTLQSLKKARASSTRKLSAKGAILPHPPANVSAATQRAIAARTTEKTPGNAPVQAKKTADFAPAPVKTLLPTSVQDMGTNLTGTQVLAQYFPTWRDELGGMFNNEQLDAVEKAFAATDEWLFVRGEDGELTARNKDEWNYEARFLTILQDSGISFTEKQIKQLIGTKGIKGFTLNRFFILQNQRGFVLTHTGHSPRQSMKGADGKLLTVSGLRKLALEGNEEAALLADELELGQGIANALRYWPQGSPEHQAVEILYKKSRNQAATKKPTAFIAIYKKYLAEHDNQSPRQSITGPDGQPLTLSELRERVKDGDVYAAELAIELEVGRGLANALNRWPQDSPEYKTVYALYDASRNKKTPAQFIAAYQKYLAEHNNQSPRQQIIGADGKLLTVSGLRKLAQEGNEEAAVLADELELGRSLAGALRRWPRNSPEYQTVKALYDASRNIAESKPTDQLYQDLVVHIREYGHYPARRENFLYMNIYNRLKYHQSTMTADGKYTDPYLQKIYEIKLWSERVKRGEVDWQQMPGVFKKHRPRIWEKRRKQIDWQKQQQIQKEFEALPTEEQKAIEQMADHMLTLWEDFEGVWWEQNHKHVIITPQTQIAFNTVLNAVRNQVPGANNVNISDTLEQVNGMQLGNDGPNYYRVIYRGDNPHLPRAEDFHNVLETQGIPQADAQAAYQLNSPHIELDGDEERVYNLLVKEGVTDKEMSAVIDALTPAGWEIRLGAHELLSQIKNGRMHIHIEQIVPTTEEYAIDTSHVLNVNLRALTQGKNPQQIAKTLRYLFSKYLKDDGHQALNNIQKAF